MTVAQAGYVAAYVATESLEPVDFDQVTVEHRPSLQVQETHYDPYGLELAGLNRAPLQENKHTWNGKERQDEFGLRWNDHGWRFYDPQLGRWVVVDPDAEEAEQESWTTYQFGFDNAVRYNDLDGRCPGGCPPGVKTVLKAATARNTVSHARKAREAGKEVATLKVGTQAFGAGAHFKVGNNIRVAVEGSAYSVEATANGKEQKVEANAIKGGALVQIGPYKVGGEGKAGAYSAQHDGAGNLSFKRDESLTGSAAASGGDLRGNRSGSVNSNNEMEFTGKLGPFAVGVVANIEKAGEFVGETVKTVSSFITNLAADITNNSFNMDKSNRTQDQYIEQEKMRK